MAADHAEACILASNHTVTIINKLKLTDDNFRRLNQGEWFNCKVCVYIAMSFQKKYIYNYTYTYAVIRSLFLASGKRMQPGTYLHLWVCNCYYIT